MMRVVFWDLDGTLTDPKLGMTRCVAYAMDKLGLQCPPPDELTWMIGPPPLDSFARLGVPDPARALELYRERYAEIGLYENIVYPGIPETLSQLQLSGYRMCLATAKTRIFACRITEHFGLSQFFSHEFGPDLDGTRSDKADLLDFALQKTGFGPAQSVMIGDRIHDIKAAHSVGMRAISVAWGYGQPDELAEADEICTAVDDLPAIIAKMFDR